MRNPEVINLAQELLPNCQRTASIRVSYRLHTLAATSGEVRFGNRFAQVPELESDSRTGYTSLSEEQLFPPLPPPEW
jgi:hypothetical protein